MKNQDIITRTWKALAAGFVAVTLVVAAITWNPAAGGVDEEQFETAMVARGPLDITVQVDGQFQAAKSTNIYPETQRGAQITWVIDEGTVAKKGDVLAKFDTGTLDGQIRDREMELQSSLNDVTKYEESLKITENDAQARIADAQATLRFAKLEYEKYGTVKLSGDGMLDEAAYESAEPPVKGDAYQAFRDASLEIVRAATALERAKADFDGMDKLLAEGFVTKNDYITEQLKVVEAQRRVESAKLAYDILLKYTYPQTVATKAHKVTEAENDLAKAKLAASVDVTSVQTRIRSGQLRYESRKKRLDDDRKELASRTITSPVDGTVLYGDPSQPWMRGHITVGGRAFRGHRMFTIPDTSSVIIRARILEADINTVRVGQKARVTVEALTGLSFDAKVSKISEYASTGQSWGQATAKGFDVEFSVEGSDERLKAGMSCDVEIVTDQMEDAVYVPVMAVFNVGDKKTCYLVEGNGKTAVEVRTGLASDRFVQILEGLEAGQRVLLAETKPSEAKTGGEAGGK